MAVELVRKLEEAVMDVAGAEVISAATEDVLIREVRTERGANLDAAGTGTGLRAPTDIDGVMVMVIGTGLEEVGADPVTKGVAAPEDLALTVSDLG